MVQRHAAPSPRPAVPRLDSDSRYGRIGAPRIPADVGFRGFVTELRLTLLRADVKPAALFGDHMVLQQGMSVPVWGWADPGEQVTVTIAGQKQSATAGADRKWMLRLTNLRASSDPIEMTIAGKNTIKIVDILVGEVWLGSGQSNNGIRANRSPRVCNSIRW